MPMNYLRRRVREVSNISLIPPMELKSIEVDVEKRIFNVNGKPFGEGCTAFSISCDAVDGYKIQMEIDTTVHLASYAIHNGEKETDRTYEVQSDRD